MICGIGGGGKTTLAAEITARVLDREPGRILVSLAGPLTLEGLLGAVITTIRRELLVRGQDRTPRLIRALDAAGRADLGWQDRLALLREHVLDRVPVLVLLDNFEDNLRPDGDAGYAVRDEVAGRAAGRAGRPTRAEPAAGHLPVPVHLARRGRAGAVVPAAGGAVPGRDDEAGLVAARPGPAR